MIVIAGDSWACGEWNIVNDKPMITHPGLSQYLMDDGHKVLNVAFGGASLADTLSQIKISLKLIGDSSTSEFVKIFVFQTEWHRHLRPLLHPDSTCSFVFNEYFMSYLISQWVHDLSRFAVGKNLEIGLIGGASDTMFFDNFEKEFPGVYVACQSMVNLCANDIDRVSDPIFTLQWEDADRFKKMCGTSKDLEFLINSLEKTENRRRLLKKYPYWFFPDDIHANRHGHKKLYELLKDKKHV